MTAESPSKRCGPAGVTVISGPTAVGKGTVVAALRCRYPQVWVSVSATTRPPRPNEEPGRHYQFVSDAVFDDLVERGELLEWAQVHGSARYGTPRGPVLEALAAGRPVILEIDIQGAEQVKRTLPGARFVFLAPPSWDELTRRLVSRGTETDAQRSRRLETARSELAAQEWFDTVIVNREVGHTVEELVGLLGLSPTLAKAHLDSDS